MTEAFRKDVAKARPQSEPSSLPIGFLNRWLTSADPLLCPIADWLRGIIEEYGVLGAGLLVWRDNTAGICHSIRQNRVTTAVPTSFPWKKAQIAVTEIQLSPLALVVPLPGESSYLIGASSRVGDCWILWLEDVATRRWTQAHRAGLSLAASAVGRIWTLPGSSASGPETGLAGDAPTKIRRFTHDFNNVLTGIMGFTELGLLQAPTGSKLNQYLTEAYELAQRGIGLVGQVRQLIQPNTRTPASIRNLEDTPFPQQSSFRDLSVGDADLAGKRILVVDDDPLLRDVIRQTLELAGCIIHTSANAQEALQCCESNPNGYDLVLADIFMPGMTGLELTQRLHALGLRLPVLLTSGQSPPDGVGDGQFPPGGAFLAKPFRGDQLVQAVGELLG